MLIKKIWENRKNLWKAKGGIFKAWCYYLFERKYVREVVETRLDICRLNACGSYDAQGKSEEAFIKGTPTCMQCGCPLKVKASSPESTCPLGYW